ncbi:7276_t:CDS:2, partial [Cetraspora pellucida]
MLALNQSTKKKRAMTTFRKKKPTEKNINFTIYELRKLKRQSETTNHQENSDDEDGSSRQEHRHEYKRIVKDDVRKEGPEVDKHVLISGPPGSSIAKQEAALKEARRILKAEENRQKRLGIKEKIKPVVTVIDELDSVGIKDTNANNSSSRDEVNGLLRLFDDINQEKLNIIVIGITNYPEALDDALVRAGRFGRKIEVGYPTDEEMDKLFDFLEKEMKSERGYKLLASKKWCW